MLDRLAGYFKYAFKGGRRAPLYPIEKSEALLGSTLSLSLFGSDRKMRADRIAQIIRDADAGDPREQAELFSVMQEKEPIIGAHLQTRRLAVAGCPMRIDSAKNPEKAEEVYAMLRKAGVRKAMLSLLDALGTGYAGVVVDWEEGGRGIKGFVPVSPTAWVFDDAGNPALAGVSGPPRPLAEFHPAQVLYMSSEGKTGLPCRSGLMRALLWMYLFKNHGFAEWNLFLERFGTPFIMGAIPSADFDKPELRRQLMQSLMSIRGAGVGIGTIDTRMEILNGAASGNKDAFEQFQRYCDEIITLTILGQLATSDSAAGWSNGGAQDKVRQDLLESDAIAIQDCLQKLLDWYCRLNFGWPDAGDMEVVIDSQPPENLKSSADMYAVLASASRRPLDPAQVFEKFGVRLGDFEPWPDRMGQFSDAPSAPKQSALVQATIRRMVDEDAFQAWQIPIDSAIKAAFGDLDSEDPDILDKFKERLPAFMASLPGLMDDFDTKAFEDAMQGAMLAAAVNGAWPTLKLDNG